MDEDDLDNGNEAEDSESTVDVMKDYVEETSSCSDAKDIFDECVESDSNDATEKPNRKKFVWASHIRIVDDKPPTYYQCTICNSHFSHANTARYHEFCGSGKKPFKCKLCDKRFVKKCDRDNHHRTHTGERPFECSVCQKTFHLKHKLSRHIRSHTGVKGDYKCSNCSRSFLCKEALRKHEVSKHASRKVAKCRRCKMVFEKNEERIKHKCSKNSLKRKLVCEICGKTFSKNWNLTVHQRIHKGQRPFECKVCKKSFRHRQHMERHSAKHQPDADFECTLCNQTFGRKDNMIRHLKLNHPDRHLGVDLNEIVKRAKRVKSDKTEAPVVDESSTSLETSMVPTIIAVDNLPNIRFAKMTPGYSSKKCSALNDGGSKAKTDKPVSAEGSTAFHSFTSSRSVILETVMESSGQTIVRRMTSRVVQQSSVIWVNASADNSGLVDKQRMLNGASHKNESPVIQPAIRSQRESTQNQNDINGASESQNRYLPVSVLCYTSSSELRTAEPKK